MWSGDHNGAPALKNTAKFHDKTSPCVQKSLSGASDLAALTSILQARRSIYLIELSRYQLASLLYLFKVLNIVDKLFEFDNLLTVGSAVPSPDTAKFSSVFSNIKDAFQRQLVTRSNSALSSLDLVDARK
jgi:hypothetical protein